MNANKKNCFLSVFKALGGILLLISAFFVSGLFSPAVPKGAAIAACTEGELGCSADAKWITKCVGGVFVNKTQCTSAGSHCTGFGTCNSCDDECTPAGTTSCATASSQKTCGNYDSDTCLEWKETLCSTGQTCTGGKCQAESTTCSCGSWAKGDCCNGTDCTKGYRKQTRTCTPSGCDTASQIVSDSTCESGNNTGTCTTDSECTMENATCSCSSGKCLCCQTVNGVTGKVCQYDTAHCYYEGNLQKCDENGVSCGSSTTYPKYKCDAGADPLLKSVLKELKPNGSVCSYFTNKDCCTGGVCNATAGTCDANAAAPVISDAQPLGGSKVSTDANITISVKTNMEAACRFSVIDTDYDSMPNTFQFTGKKAHSSNLGKMIKGDYVFYVRCKGVNCVKNTASAVIKFTVIDATGDTLAPEVTNLQPSGTVTWTNVTLSVETNEAAECHLDKTAGKNFDDMDIVMATTDSRHHTDTEDLSSTANGKVTYYVKCKDTAGNISEEKTIEFDYTAGTGAGDTTPPVIFDPKPTGTISDNTPTLEVTTDENATCRFSFADKAYDKMTDTFTQTGGTAHQYTYSSSLTDGTYKIYVRCKDDDGNVNTKSTTIDFIIDTSASGDDDTTGDDTTGDDTTGDDTTSDDTTTDDTANDTTGDDTTGDDTTTDDDSTDDDTTSDDTTDDTTGDDTTSDDTTGDDDNSDDVTIDGLTITLVEPTSDITVSETDFTVSTNHNAVCKLSDKDEAYSSMPWTFTETGGKTHTVHLIDFDPGDSKVYVRCWDMESGTVSSKSAVFTVTYDDGSGGDDDDDTSTVNGLTITLVEPTGDITVSETDFTITTSHDAICKLSDKDEDYSAMSWYFTETGGKTHTVHLIDFDPGDSKVYVRCWDMESGTVSSKSAVFTVTYNDGSSSDDDDNDTTGDNDTTDDDNDTTDDDTTDDDTTDDDNDTTDDDTTDDDSTDDDSTDDDNDTTTDDDSTDDDTTTDDDNGDNDTTTDDDTATDDDNDTTTDDDNDDTANTTAPVISDGSPTGTVTSTTFTVSVTTDENATCKLDLKDRDYDLMSGTFSKTGTTAHSKKMMALSDGSYKVYVRCKDTAGNKNTASTVISFAVSLGGPDTTPPVISSLKPSGTISSNDIELSAATNENATCKFSTKDEEYDSMASDFENTGGTAHTSQMFLASDGSYTVYVRCKDAAGNINTTSGKITFVVSASEASYESSGNKNSGSKATNPLTKGRYVWQGINTGDLGAFPWENWYAGYEFQPKTNGAVTELCGFFDNNTTKVQLYDSAHVLLASSEVKSFNNWNCAKISPVAVAKGQNYFVVAKAARTSVYYRYQCCNPPLLPGTADNVEVVSGVRQSLKTEFGNGLKRYNYMVFGLVDVKFSTGIAALPAGNDTTPPVITDPLPSGTISNSTPTLSVTTDENAICRFEHSGVSYSSMKHAFTTTGGLTHTKKIGPLKDGTYTRYVRCKDEAGNKNTKSIKIKFTVKNGAAGDTTPPVISSPKPTGTITDGSPTISVATDEIATCKYCQTDSSYNSLCKSFDKANTKTHTATVGPLNDDDYTYYVRCKDEVGNTNTSSKKIEFTVNTGTGDTTPPTISNVKVDPTSGEAGDSFKITAKVTDNSDISSVKAKIQYPDGTTIATVTLYDDGSHNDGSKDDGVYGREWITTGREEGTYYIDVKATDEYDNSSTKNNGATITLESSSSGDCKTITKNGSAADKVDITFVPCGYGSDLTSFEANVKTHIARFSFTKDTAKFNFHIVTKTGITCGSNTCTNLDSYGSTFREYASVCDTDVVVGFLKSAQDGGCSYLDSGLSFVNQSTDENVTIHETGHAFFGLGDEYTYSGSGSCSAYDMSDIPNCENTSSCSKWSDVSGTSCIRGCTCTNNYRPASNCMMNNSYVDPDFCPVCLKHIKSVLSSYK